MKFRFFRDNQFLQAITIGAVVFVLWEIRLIILVVFLAFLATTIIYPLVALLKKRNWPTVLAVLVPVVVLLTLFGVLLYLIIPPFADKISHFASNLPGLINEAAHKLHISANVSSLSTFVNDRFGSIGHFAVVITGKVITIIAGALTILVLTVYWLASYETVQREILSYFHGGKRRRLRDIWRRIETKMRLWIRAHLILNTIVAFLVWLSMTLLGIGFAEVLALIAFMVEIIPTAGPIIAAIPAIVLGLSFSLLKGVLVTIIYIIIQQIESHILSPLLLGKTVRLHPIIIILSLLLGYEVYGILGALIAVPVTLCISSAVDSYKEHPRQVPPASSKSVYRDVKT
ncbi:MAG TPA: AI-2E family transporter [Candidatus Saccharimonadales bacterium]|nr:AI-2E family transporter [Candidatus Saccharimonadales bacterium]